MEKNKKRIVFYSGFPPFIFLYKIARIFRKNDYETILFTMSEKERFDLNFYKDAFDKIICSNFQFSKSSLKISPYLIKKILNFIRFLIKLKSIKPDIVIGISGNNWQLELVHKYFFKKYHFVYFPYDILSLFHDSKKQALKKGIKEFELNAEKYCFENANGIIYKGNLEALKLFNGKKFYKADIQKLQLNFLPYCSNEFSIPINKNKLSKIDKEIHLVYPGFILNISENIKEIKKSLNQILKQKIHIHIYGLVTHISKNKSEKYFTEFFQEFIKNKYFHLHSPLGPKEIINEISKYDFGFYWSYIFNVPEVKYHIGTKVSTFLEAGLPIIYHQDCLFLNKLMKSYNLNITYNHKNLKNLKKRLKKLNYNRLIKDIEYARKDFDMDKNFPILKRFINKVISLKKKDYIKT